MMKKCQPGLAKATAQLRRRPEEAQVTTARRRELILSPFQNLGGLLVLEEVEFDGKFVLGEHGVEGGNQRKPQASHLTKTVWLRLLENLLTCVVNKLNVMLVDKGAKQGYLETCLVGWHGSDEVKLPERRHARRERASYASLEYVQEDLDCAHSICIWLVYPLCR